MAMVEMKKRMKAILHKRVHSIRESVLRQRNENYAQKFLLCKQSEGSMKSSLRIAFFYRSNNSSVASPSSSFFFGHPGMSGFQPSERHPPT